MEKRVVIIGANGQIGREFVKAFNSNLIELTRNELDITEYEKVRKKIEEIKPDVLINTAAFHKTDECEKDIEKAFRVNSFAVKNITDICNDNDVTLVHFSTDYVFDGTKREPYTEEDIPNPINVYGLSKLSGENFVKKLKRYLLIRTAYVFGVGASSQKRTNLVETLLKSAKTGKVRAVDDQFFSPTYAKDLAEKIIELMESEKYGIYHLTNIGKCSVYDFAKKIFEFVGINPELERTSLEEVNANPEKAKRPRYSVLTSINLKKQGISQMRRWEDALADYLKNRGEDGI